MRKMVCLLLLGSLWAGCQDEQQMSAPVVPVTPILPVVPVSASILPPTSSGPAGFAYAMQTGTQCFVLDNKSRFWQYDPVIRSFSSRAAPILPDFDRSGFTGVDLFTFSSIGKVFLGGQSIFGIPGQSEGFPAFFYVYDPVANTWTSATPCPGNGKVPDLGRIAFFANGKGYVCFFVNERNSDGSTNYDKALARCYEYDPDKDQWSLRIDTPLPLPPTLILSGVSQAAMLNGKSYWAVSAYVKEKRGQSLLPGDLYTCLYELDPLTNHLILKLSINTLGSLGVAIPSFRLALSGSNNVWLVSESSFTGTVSTGNQLVAYTPATNQLVPTSARVLTEPAKNLSGFIGFSLPKRLYIGMGEYGLIDGTPGGAVSGFASFEVD